MSKIISSVVALIVSAVWVSAALAVAGDKGFHYAEAQYLPVLNERLESLIEVSLKKDSTGNTLLDANNCNDKGGCATPMYYLEAFRQMEGLPHIADVSKLPEFLRSLKEEDDPGGTHDVVSLRPIGGGKFRVVMDGVQRGFEPGEKAWVWYNEKTKRKIRVLASYCGNPVYRMMEITIIGGTPSYPPGGDAQCPRGRFVIGNVWPPIETYPAGLRRKAEELVAVARAKDSAQGTRLEAYDGDAFSRTLGPDLRKQIKIRAAFNADLKVRYVDQKTGQTLREVGVLKLTNGIGRFQFPDDPRDHVIDVIFPSDVESPVHSGGLQRIRIKPSEWGVKCEPNINGSLLPSRSLQ